MSIFVMVHEHVENIHIRRLKLEFSVDPGLVLQLIIGWTICREHRTRIPVYIPLSGVFVLAW